MCLSYRSGSIQVCLDRLLDGRCNTEAGRLLDAQDRIGRKARAPRPSNDTFRAKRVAASRKNDRVRRDVSAKNTAKDRVSR